jgi:hypothetical protein
VRSRILRRCCRLRRSFGFFLADKRAVVPRHAGQISIRSRERLRPDRSRLLGRELADIGRLTP